MEKASFNWYWMTGSLVIKTPSIKKLRIDSLFQEGKGFVH